MTLAFAGGAGNAPRYVTVPLRGRVVTETAARLIAAEQLAALPDDEIALLATMATPDSVTQTRDVLEAAYGMIRTVKRVHTATGNVHCAACGHRLGLASSPHLGYLSECSVCHRALTITFDGDLIVVSVQSQAE